MYRSKLPTDSEDPTVTVEITDLSNPYCIRVRMGDTTIDMHTRSAIDLHRKLGNAIASWLADTAEMLIVAGATDMR